jgi:predicted ATP-dependent endonuclease of OLD family
MLDQSQGLSLYPRDNFGTTKTQQRSPAASGILYAEPETHLHPQAVQFSSCNSPLQSLSHLKLG